MKRIRTGSATTRRKAALHPASGRCDENSDDTSANEGAVNYYKVRAYTTLEAGDTDLTVYGAYSDPVGETHAAA